MKGIFSHQPKISTSNWNTRLLSLAVITSLLVSLVPVSIIPAQGSATRAAAAEGPASPSTSSGAPDMLLQPLSISRSQSNYTAGVVEVAFTLTNNLPVTRLPDIPAGATSEETAALLAGFDPAADANTLASAAISDALAPGVTLLSASQGYQYSAGVITWQMAGLPPLASITVSMTLQTPAAGADFVELDNGAQANALRWGSPVSASARPAAIIPAGIDGSLVSATPDADIYDPELSWYTAGFGQDPLQAFTAVQSFRTDLYNGALRGTRGTLWGAAGNSLDKASALIAMLRLSGIPARYRHGTLTAIQAQALITSLFPAAGGLAGYLPAGTELADPANDAALIALAADHWWVEAYLPGTGWTDLDPTYPNAAVGQSFATPSGDGSDRSAVVPADQHHTLQVRLKVEQYSTFPQGGSNLSSFYALDQTFDVSALAGKRLTLGHLVSEALAGGVFSSITRTYTPYLAIEDNNQGYQGDSFQDYLSNFPLSSSFTTAEWLEYELRSPDGIAENFSREVKDLIGPAARRLGGGLSLALGTSSQPFFLPEDAYVNWVLPNTISRWALRRQSAGVLENIVALGSSSQNLLQIAAGLDPNTLLSGDDLQAYKDARSQAAFISEYLLTRIGLDFAWQADSSQAQIESGLRTRLYYASPRVFTIASVGDPTDVVTTTVDLRHTTAQALVYPGQAQSAGAAAQWVKGLNESILEGQALENATGIPPLTTARVFEEMSLQGIDPLLISPGEYGTLDAYDFSPSTQAHVLTALEAGKMVLIPSRAVQVDGEPVFAWWEIDPLTGETVSVGENGLRPAALEYRLLKIIVEAFIESYAAGSNPASGNSTVALAESALAIGLKLRSYFFAVADGLSQGAQASFQAGAALLPDPAAPASGEWRSLPAHLCPLGACGVEQFFLQGLNPGLIPLPELAFAYTSAPGESTAIAALAAASNGSGGTPSFTLAASPTASSITPGSSASFQAQISTNFSDDFSLAAYAPSGWTLSLDANGQAAAQPPAGTLPGSYEIQLVAQSSLHPELVDTATHTITLLDQSGVQLSITPEPNISVAMGSARFLAPANQTNDGESEIPGVAFKITLTNTSGAARSFELSISGPPASWVVLNGANATNAVIALDSGATAHVGLYLQPPPGTLPAPGTSYPVNVSAAAQGAPALNAQTSAAFSMPSQPFNYMSLSPAQLYLTPQGSTVVSLEIENAGNAGGDSSLAAFALPPDATLDGLPASQTLATGAATSIPLTLNVGDIPAGASFPLIISGNAPGSTTQYALAQVRLVGPYSGAIFQAADHLAAACQLGEPGLSAALETLAVAIANLEATCDAGACDLGQRDRAVDAAREAAAYAGGLSSLVTAGATLLQAADAMAAHSSAAALQTDMQAMRDAISPTLQGQVCELSEHLPSLRWTPGYSAALPGQTVDYTLALTNQGSVTTTYAVSATVPAGLQAFSATLNPGETDSFVYPVSSPGAGIVTVSAQAVATGADVTLPSLGASAAARLNVVDRFVQLTSVQPEPSFVEAGVSSTNIFMQANNLANLPIDATARLNLLAPGGAAVHTADIPVTLFGGGEQSYDLGAVNTSGWALGVYTATVDLLCSGDLCPAPDPLPDGSGYGYLTVGQGLLLSHAVAPQAVPSGTFTVTTLITSALASPAILPPAAAQNAAAYAPLLAPFVEETPPDAIETLPGEPLVPAAPQDTWAADVSPITRTESSSAAVVYTGSWSNRAITQASGGSTFRGSAAGSTAALTFTGEWIGVGFVGGTSAGKVELFLDGISQGVLDLYRNDGAMVSAYYGGLPNASHTLSVTVQPDRNPFSTGTLVDLDFFDTWDGTPMPDGTFEQDSVRVFRSNGWGTTTNAAASGGSYASALLANAWFPFTGDSVTFQAFALASGGTVKIWLDGEYLTSLNLYNNVTAPRLLSFDGLGAGAHMLQVSTYRGGGTMDAFTAPGAAPFYTPPAIGSYHRYEEDDPALSYNGFPFAVTKSSWDMLAGSGLPEASASSVAASNQAGDTISLTFDGRWVGVGFHKYQYGGQAEIFLDGVSQGIVGLYSPQNDILNLQFGDLVTGTHTLTIAVLGQIDPPGTQANVRLDYFEAWDGQPLPDDLANANPVAPDERVSLGGLLSLVNNPNAFQGDFVSVANNLYNTNVWYAFTGDSFVFYPFSRQLAPASVDLYVDGLLVDTVDFVYPFTQQPLSFHYAGFGPGIHIVRVSKVNNLQVDAFQSNPPTTNTIRPLAEWWDNTLAGASIWGGLHVPVAVGDVNNDGIVEIAVASSDMSNNGTLALYRGDGGDTGDGDPILWSHPYNIFNGFEDVGAPALAELDGQPGAEIIHPSAAGLYVFHHDGSIYWFTDTLQSHAFFATPAVGNLDLDPEPEIVVNMNANLVVFDADGSLAWRLAMPSAVGMPVLADLTGDGLLDILVNESGTANLHLYEFNFGSPTLAWTASISTTLGIYGSPAVADIDGLQPGGDPGPEIAITSSGWLHVLDADGSPLHATALDAGSAGGVSIADLDGDGEVELATTMYWSGGGKIYAANADGTLLWSAPALDNSPLSVSVMDLEGDGVYEVAWNGAVGGFTIFNGADGTVLFNEPHSEVISQTGSDYPVIADVDLDGYAEIVVTSQRGLRVFGYDGAWGPSRPIWNQHTYHITNINDNLSVPFHEADSWQVHNTYRTQTPLRYPMPVYSVALTHTVGVDQLTVLNGTFSSPPDSAAHPDYTWSYQQEGIQPLVATSFQSRLDGLQPGESRMVAQGTLVDYTLPSGSNQILLPPLYVSVRPLVSIVPSLQVISSGEVGVYELTIANPLAAQATYNLELTGLPDGWANLPPTLSVPASSAASLTFTATVPAEAGASLWSFSVQADTPGGPSGQAGAELQVEAPVLQAVITPTLQTTPSGQWAAFDLALTNLDAVEHTVAITGAGLAELDLPPAMNLAAGSSQMVSFNARTPGDGPHPFTLVVESQATGEKAQASAILEGTGAAVIALAMDPPQASTGLGSPAYFNLSLNNLGTQPAALSLDVAAPTGWAAALSLFGQPASQVTLSPNGLDTTVLQLSLTPPANVTPGIYPFTVTASDASGVVQTTGGAVQVLSLGVQIALLSGPSQIEPGGSGAWQVQVTNTGSQADTYDLGAFGALSAQAALSAGAVTLSPGQSQTVQLQTSVPVSAQAGPLLLGVFAQSHANSSVQAEDSVLVEVAGVLQAAAFWNPNPLLAPVAAPATAELLIENTGSLEAVFQVTLDVSPGISAVLLHESIPLPPGGMIALPVEVRGDQTGVFTISAEVAGGAAPLQANLTVWVGSQPRLIFLPLMPK